MGTKTLEFHFDFGSPTTCLAYTQVQRIAREPAASRCDSQMTCNAM